MNTHPPRSLVALLCAQLLLTACNATARSVLPDGEPGWPEPRPPTQPEPRSAIRSVPNFQAPSATHCARPIQTREVPGRAQPQNGGAAADAELAAAVPLHRHAVPASPAPAAAAAAHAEAMATRKERSERPASTTFAPVPQPSIRQAPQAVVTAGMVDDNADFSAYLAFRERTQVAHRARDIRARHLLQVKDSQGRPVADAEVAVQGSSGHAMWARTDTAGRAWLHPDAFDPARSQSYRVAVRKAGQQAVARLQRGQKSAVDVVLDTRQVPQRARLDLVFLIDATGSMADEIGKLKATLRSIADDVARLPSQPDICFGLVAYRDRGDAFLLRSHDFSNDLGAFQGVLNGLHAGGGGDYPEAMNEALHETVHQLSWRGEGATRLVVLLADAPPHLDRGGPFYDDDMLAALGKGIKVFSVGASGLDRQGEYIQRQIAQYTGGRFVFLTYDQASRPSSGPGRDTVHDVDNYSVDTLDRLVVRLVRDELEQAVVAR